ncbi:glycoside hydrolase family 18 protein [Plicaturopsis crispa FD-325 SS-3]|nr:glycoside hydrolase family 18 protein [Plicaturopsis crispa FD-325 SS-3]
MVSFSFPRLAAFFCAAICAGSVAALPVENSLAGFGDKARDILTRSSKATTAPHWVIYSDKWVSGETGPPDASQLKGYNVFALSFLLTSGAADQALEWTTLTADQRTAVKTQYAAAGISLVVSVFGSTDTPVSSGADATATAQTIAAWVKQYDLDGVDVDFEDFAAMNAGTGTAWLVTFTQALRAELPQGTYIITHAPVAPWFSASKFPTGYLEVEKQVGSLIDWYNIQFYNQGTTEYTTCDGLLTTSSSTWPASSLFEIVAAGVDQSKLVIGKPATGSDATNGYVDAATLAGCLATAKSQGWDAGAMVWQFPDAAADWISTVRGTAFPE